MRVGYARVSTTDQDTSLQLDALGKDGVDVIFKEHGSGVGPRPELQNALASLAVGDVLIVWKIDRVARSLTDLLSILARLKKVGASIRSLTEPIDTSTPIGEFTFQILGAVAQLERSMIRERTIAGQIAAYRRGVKLGVKKRKVDDVGVQRMRDMHATGNFTYPAIAAEFNVHASTAKRLITGRKNRVCMPVLSKYL